MNQGTSPNGRGVTGVVADDTPASDADGGCWIALDDPAGDELAVLGNRFGLHELAIEDAEHAHQRPKLEIYDETVLLVVKPAAYHDETETIEIGELLVLFGEDFVVSVGHDLPERIHADATGENDLHDRSPAAVVHGLLDRVVDGYQPIVDGLEVDVREIESDVFSTELTNSGPRIYRLKRQVLALLRNTQPLVEPLGALTRRRVPGVPESLHEYFRDVEDHLRRIVSHLEQISALLTDVLQANHSQLSMVQNDDMRRMSAWAAIFLLPTLMAGIWGMNFEHMPELEWYFGYAFALGSMTVATGLLYLRFRASGWLGPRQSPSRFPDRHDADSPNGKDRP